MTIESTTLRNAQRTLPGERLLVRFNLFGLECDRPRAEFGSLRVMMFDPSDGRQAHTWAHLLESGLYEVTVPAPEPGPCYLFFSCPKSGIGYADLPHLILQSSVEGYTLIRRPPESAPADRLCPAPLS